MLNAAQRIGLRIAKGKKAPDVFRAAIGPADVAALPRAVAFALPAPASGHWAITFSSPTPEGVEYLGRNHPFVAALARFLMEEALTKAGAAAATRCGVLRTRGVSRRTILYLLRVRYLLEQPERAPLLSEEVLVIGAAQGKGGRVDWLAPDEAMPLLAATPDANISMPEKQQLAAAALEAWPSMEQEVRDQIRKHASHLEKSHKRIRQAVSLKVRQMALVPQLPPDVLGVLVLEPVA